MADGGCPLQLATLLRYPPPPKATRRTRKPVAFTNMDNRPCGGAEHVQFFVVAGCRSGVSGPVLFPLVGHSLS